MRRRAWLSREGWYYLGVLLFILGGAILRNVNLLYVLAGTLIGPLLLNWRLAMQDLLGLQIRRREPLSTSAGETLTIEYAISNLRNTFARMLVIEDWLMPLDDPNRRKVPSRGVAVEVPPGQTRVAICRWVAPRRGRYRLGPMRISTRFPLGLVRAHFFLRETLDIVVLPRIGRLAPHWSAILAGAMAGDQSRATMKGLTEGDYFGLRPWQRGDSLRWIHWRTTARTGTPTVRQFEQHRRLDVALVLDPHLPAQAGDSGQAMAEAVYSLAATAIADFCRRGQGRLAVVLAGRTLECWSGSSAEVFARDVLEQLAVAPSATEGDVEAALRAAREVAGERSCQIVISSRAAADALRTSGEAGACPEPDWWLDVSSDEVRQLFFLDVA
jgi:uncharacterized protein (DUF58 family)